MKLRSARLLPFAAALLFGLGASACSTHYLPNTDVEETELNRRVIEFCEDYRRAVERRNVPLLLKFAHPSYYEDGGTVSTSDDLDYAGLREYLEGRFKKTTGIRYEIRYRDVRPGRNNSIYVDYTYTASFKVLGPDGEEVWKRSVADNRLELVPEGETFRIIAGM